MVNLELLSQPSVLQLARAGDFQAIAYWLNTYLVPQDIYARVAVDRPGWLLVLVEFCQPPDRDRLNRFVCHRLCRLNSDVIQGVRIMARPLGSANIWWDQSIRLAAEPKRSARPARPPLPIRRTHTPHPSRRAVQPHPSTRSNRLPTPSSTPPRSPRKRRRSPAALVSHRPAITPVLAKRMQTLTESARALTIALVESTRQLSPAQVAMLGKVSAAVFLVGFGVEIAGRNLALWGDPSSRPMAIQTASGKVSVIQANAATNATDPTVTLTFSGNPTVKLTAADLQDTAIPATGIVSDPIQVGAGGESDILMTNLDHSLNDAQSLLSSDPVSSDPGSNLGTKTAGLTRSPSSNSVTVVSLSSDPLRQGGSAGLVKTLDAIEKAGMYPVGAGRNRQEARRPEIIDVRGKRIAYLGYTDSDTNAAKRWQAGTNPALKDQVTEDIRAIRDQVDWVVVNYHWSQDLASFPADWQMTVARHAIDQGADLVVGYHPNVLQGAEIYKGRAIAYSLGDFVFQDAGRAVNASAANASAVNAFVNSASASSPSASTSSASGKPATAPVKTQYDTAMLKVSIKDDQMKLEFLPVQVKDAQPAIAQGQKQTEILRYLGQASALFETPLRSPTVLNRLTHTSEPHAAPNAVPNVVPKLAPAPASPALPTPAEDKSAPAPDNGHPENGSDSFINYPQAPTATPQPSTTPQASNDAKLSDASFSSSQASQPTSTPENGVVQASAIEPPGSQSVSQPPLAFAKNTDVKGDPKPPQLLAVP